MEKTFESLKHSEEFVLNGEHFVKHVDSEVLHNGVQWYTKITVRAVWIEPEGWGQVVGSGWYNDRVPEVHKGTLVRPVALSERLAGWGGEHEFWNRAIGLVFGPTVYTVHKYAE